MKSDNGEIYQIICGEHYLQKHLRICFSLLILLEVGTYKIFLGTLIGKGHLGELDMDGNTLLISVF
jgi:hypothetical protein